MHLTCTCTCTCTPQPLSRADRPSRDSGRVKCREEARALFACSACSGEGRAAPFRQTAGQQSVATRTEPRLHRKTGVRVAPCATPGWLDGLGSGAKLSVRPLTPLSLRDRARLLPASRQLLSTVSAQRLIPARRPPRVAANPPPRPSSLRGSTKGSLLSRALCVLDLAITCICELHSTLTRELTLFDLAPLLNLVFPPPCHPLPCSARAAFAPGPADLPCRGLISQCI